MRHIPLSLPFGRGFRFGRREFESETAQVGLHLGQGGLLLGSQLKCIGEHDALRDASLGGGRREITLVEHLEMCAVLIDDEHLVAQRGDDIFERELQAELRLGLRLLKTRKSGARRLHLGNGLARMRHEIGIKLIPVAHIRVIETTGGLPSSRTARGVLTRTPRRGRGTGGAEGGIAGETGAEIRVAIHGEGVVVGREVDLRPGIALLPRFHGDHVGGEINRWDGGVLSERGLHPRHEQGPYLMFIFEFDLALRRMYVDIYRRGIHLEFEEITGLGIGGYKPLEAADNRLVEIGMAHIAAIDYKKLQGVAPPGEFGTRQETVYLDELRVDLDGEELHLEE